MKRLLRLGTAGIFLLGAGGAFAQTTTTTTVPGPGQCFNGGDPNNSCSGGCGSSSPTCAADDPGCVPNTKDHLKCSDAIVKGFQKAIGCVSKCHCKQAANLLAGKPFNEETCEGHNPPKNNACEDKLDGAFTKVTPLCSSTQLTLAHAEESALFAPKNVAPSFDAQNGNVFCDSTSGAMIMTSDPDDAGWVPNSKDMLKCECTVAKNLSKLAVDALRCHIKLADAFFKGKPNDENSCEEVDPAKGKAALQKFTQAETVILGKNICPPCLDKPHQAALGAGVLAQVEAGNSLAYPCNEGP